MTHTPSPDIPRQSLIDERLSRMPVRRGLTGARFYRVDDVEQLLNHLKDRFEAIISDRDRVQRLNDRLADQEQRRRFGSLPSALPIEQIDPVMIAQGIRVQEHADQTIAAARAEANRILAAARQTHLRSEAEVGTDAELDELRERLVAAEQEAAQLRQVLESWRAYWARAAEDDRDRFQQRLDALNGAASEQPAREPVDRMV